jgi:hypothetical protein
MSASAKYPRVGLLAYALSIDPHHNFFSAPPTAGMLGQFAFRLNGHAAEFEPTEDLATIDAARSALEPMLRIWHVSATLQFGPAGFEFFFLRGFIDESAEQQETRRNTPMVSVPVPSSITIGYDHYPVYLQGLAIDDCVRDLAEHYLASWLSPRGMLLHAYAMVTRVEAAYGGTKQAAAALQITRPCLRNLAKLASERGVGAAARKFTDNRPRHELTRDESNWVRSMTRLILYRSAVRAGGNKPRPPLTVASIKNETW